MTIDFSREFLGWCVVINFGLLMWWLAMIIFARDWVHKMHGRWFRLTAEQFDLVHYAGMAFFKIAIFLFNVVPYVALRIVG